MIEDHHPLTPVANWLDEDLKFKRITLLIFLAVLFMIALLSIPLLTPPRCAVNNSTTYCIEAGPEARRPRHPGLARRSGGPFLVETVRRIR